jgi:spermidine/putrescine transport system permease protein
MSTRKFPSLSSIYFLAIIALLYLPIVLLIIFSFNNATALVFPLKGFTLQWYGKLFQNRELLKATGNSLMIGVGSSFLATLLGTMGAIAVVRFKLPGRGAFLAVAALPLVIPYVILGVSLLILFNEIGMPLSAFAAGLAHVIISIPYAMLIVASRLVGFPDNLEEAAMDLGASYWGALLRVTIPICSPALLAAFLLCFTMSFDEFAIASFLVGTDATLPVYLYSQLRFPTRLPMVVALAAMLMTITMTAMVLSEWLRRAGQTPARKA